MERQLQLKVILFPHNKGSYSTLETTESHLIFKHLFLPLLCLPLPISLARGVNFLGITQNLGHPCLPHSLQLPFFAL